MTETQNETDETPAEQPQVVSFILKDHEALQRVINDVAIQGSRSVGVEPWPDGCWRVTFKDEGNVEEQIYANHAGDLTSDNFDISNDTIDRLGMAFSSTHSILSRDLDQLPTPARTFIRRQAAEMLATIAHIGSILPLSCRDYLDRRQRQVTTVGFEKAEMVDLAATLMDIFAWCRRKLDLMKILDEQQKLEFGAAFERGRLFGQKASDQQVVVASVATAIHDAICEFIVQGSDIFRELTCERASDHDTVNKALESVGNQDEIQESRPAFKIDTTEEERAAESLATPKPLSIYLTDEQKKLFEAEIENHVENGAKEATLANAIGAVRAQAAGIRIPKLLGLQETWDMARLKAFEAGLTAMADRFGRDVFLSQLLKMAITPDD